MHIDEYLHKRSEVFNLSRRKFLGGCTACATGLIALSSEPQPVFGSTSIMHDEKTKIRIVFAHPSSEGPCWPNIGYDFEGRKRELLKMFRSQCPGIEFLPVTAQSNNDGEKILQSDHEVDSYIVYMVGCLWGNVPETIASSGKPLIMVDDLFAGSGKFLLGYAGMKRKGMKVIAVSSSRFEDVVEAVRCLDCLKKMQLSTILVVGSDAEKNIEEVFGTRMKGIEFTEINKAYENVNQAQAKKVADRWINEAEKIIEPSRQEIEKSAGMYLAMRNLLQKHNAQAIAVNCLGGIYSGSMVPVYPCLGFMQLDNDGYVGTCEADQRSAITKLLMVYLTGRPGFISDPVIDTSKNQIIYAHCVATTRVYGPEGPSNPYHIRDHSEDRKGACNRSLMPLGEMTTTIQFDHQKKQVILHQGTTVENVDEDKACRTKLAVEVKGDIFKLMNYWDRWGWHRVTFFGDLKRQVYQIASLLNFEVIEEA